MNTSRPVIDRDGQRAAFSQDPPAQTASHALRLDDGTRIDVPTALVREDGECYRADLSFDELRRAMLTEAEEHLRVRTETRDTARVRVSTRVEEETQIVDEPLSRDTIEIDRVPIGTYVDERLPVRHEGDTIVVPVYEEVLVVEKRLLLREEVRIVRRREETRDPQEVTLRRTHVEVERTPLPPTP